MSGISTDGTCLGSTTCLERGFSRSGHDSLRHSRALGVDCSLQSIIRFRPRGARPTTCHWKTTFSDSSILYSVSIDTFSQKHCQSSLMRVLGYGSLPFTLTPSYSDLNHGGTARTSWSDTSEDTTRTRGRTCSQP